MPGRLTPERSPEYYDYLITGAGCAGLSLVMHMIGSPALAGKKILLIDRCAKTQNDRTWCFWEKGAGLFDPVVCQNWKRIHVYGEGERMIKDLAPYSYKMIRGLDFYRYCLDHIARQAHVTLRYGEVKEIVSNEAETYVVVEGEKIAGRYIFNSILPEGRSAPYSSGQPAAPGRSSATRRDWHLWQHFKGWVIETPDKVFDPGEATLMDFRVSQQLGTSFVYVMPFSSSRALVEYTVFSEKLLESAAYDAALKEYIGHVLQIGNYTVREEEFGVIPMTTRPFAGRDHNILAIGTAGGRTKASSGYTFQFIQKQSRAICDALAGTGALFAGDGYAGCSGHAAKFPFDPPARFRFYDSVLLNVLASGKLPGEKVFTRLFRNNRIHDIFSFLDNESRLSQELRIIGSLPVRPFLRAGMQEFGRAF